MKKVFRILGIAVFAVAMSFTTPSEKKLIVIDAGHGGHDIGATHGFHNEKKITSNIAKKIKGLNTGDKVEIVLLRDTDNFKSLTDRVDEINKLNADLVISLHVNKNANESASGVEAYVSEENSKYEVSKAHAEELVSILSTEKIKSRGVKTAPFMVLKKSKTAAVTLELGFLSNSNDREYLISDQGQNEIASKISSYLNK
ncbi:N-acetylmuramoyl-L-alanine amidase family protein [Flavobacterium macacae]|uniref:N-acetylmuramoyl-L-alanine amidase n=1 Tax=Flavobacterium macacae TaxID=2488993 RepID=A0A3P3WAC8_9FLAO|nr:N-acetylmuramoyl-L-alanine amidase [Flavobacterium macacae]RRJ92122.1 N-acetylmuramoyl-L-alanine amidase [Flavobacterium macacae]